MAGLAGLAYTAAGGVVGSAVTTYVSRVHERRRLRAEVMQQFHRVAAVRDAVSDIVPRRAGSPGRYPASRHLLATKEFGVVAALDGGGDAERALRAAFSDLVVASLSAGVPRRVLDFAGGAEDRALQCEVIRLVDHRVGGVLGDSLDDLVTACEEYRQATAQLLLQSLWHPWHARWRMYARFRSFRTAVDVLHHRQQAAVSVLAGPPHSHALDRALARRLPPAPDGSGASEASGATP